MSAPVIKGWCPGAHQPMMSGDGLVVRVRPFRGELTAGQVVALCNIATEFGNGILDLTSRANLQIRGVSEADHQSLLVRLNDLALIDTSPSVERKRNILMPYSWIKGDLTDRLYNALLAELPRLPELPGKIGFALDTADAACLGTGSADFRFELSTDGELMLRADGASTGRCASEGAAMSVLQEMVAWFVSSGGLASGRMARHLEHITIPENFTDTKPRDQQSPVSPGPVQDGILIGAPFGKMEAQHLQKLVQNSEASHVRLMLDRLFFLKGGRVDNAEGFVNKPSSILKVHACPGAPYCPQASVSTMEVARELAETATTSVHVSGCAKGCAYPKRAALTLVGRNGQFDLVQDGRPWDDPLKRGVDPLELIQKADLI